MARWVKGPAAKPDSWSSVHGTHVVEGENHSHRMLPDLHTRVMVCERTYTYTGKHKK